MKIIEINIQKYLTTTIHDPSPHRLNPDELPVGERQKPIIYTCENCGNQILFKPELFEKHVESAFTNLSTEENQSFKNYLIFKNIETESFLDFYCPECKQPTFIAFKGRPSGYWGAFYLEIESVLIINENEERDDSFYTIDKPKLNNLINETIELGEYIINYEYTDSNFKKYKKKIQEATDFTKHNLFDKPQIRTCGIIRNFKLEDFKYNFWRRIFKPWYDTSFYFFASNSEKKIRNRYIRNLNNRLPILFIK